MLLSQNAHNLCQSAALNTQQSKWSFQYIGNNTVVIMRPAEVVGKKLYLNHRSEKPTLLSIPALKHMIKYSCSHISLINLTLTLFVLGTIYVPVFAVFPRLHVYSPCNFMPILFIAIHLVASST